MENKQAISETSYQHILTELNETFLLLKPSDFQAFVNIFRDSNVRWFFSGQGRSGLVAQMVAMRFMHAGFLSYFVGEPTAPAITKNDRLLIISGSGETLVSLGFAQMAQEVGAQLIVVSKNAQSNLAKMADHSLILPQVKSQQFGGSLFEQSALILMDAVILQLKGQSQTAYSDMAKRHTNFQ